MRTLLIIKSIKIQSIILKISRYIQFEKRVQHLYGKNRQDKNDVPYCLHGNIRFI